MKILILICVLLISAGNISATGSEYFCYEDDGTGTFYTVGNQPVYSYYDSSGTPIYISWYATCAGSGKRVNAETRNIDGSGKDYYYNGATTTYWSSSVYLDLTGNKYAHKVQAADVGNDYKFYVTASLYPITSHTISGSALCGISTIDLWINTSDGLMHKEQNLTPSSYSFDLKNDTSYRLVFSDGHYYDFTCIGDEVYDYDICQYTTLHLKDYCGYTMWGACTDVYMSDGGVPSTYEFVDYYQWRYEINLPSEDVPFGKMLDIYFDTDMGTHHEILYADGEEHDILHPSKSWRMTFTVLDDETHTPIEGARIVAEQTCTINPEHPLKSYLLTDEKGQGTFIGLSGGFFNFSIWAAGYKIDRAWYGGYGHSAFVTDLYDDAFLNASRNETIDPRNETGNQTEGCSTYFTNENGIATNRINDTDSLVYLNYSNSNCSSTLKFQRLYGSYWMTKASYNIPALQNGSKTIPNSNFSNYDACYRAYMYSYECDCNNTHSLYVLNETVQEEQHYENLSAHCKFKHHLGGGQVDYREDVEILTYAYSNTSHTLLNINLTLYDSSGVIASKQCDWVDFAGASPKWYYVWSPSVNYDIGENYTIVMTGYNGHNLSADEVWTSNIRNNKLTINVKDNHNTPIAYSTVFVQNWGSQALDSDTSFIVSGLQDQVYQYKATKSGYTSSGWASVNLSGADQTVTCILVEQATESVTGYKLKDNEIKAFFIPLMYLLFVMILIGGLMNAAKR